MLGKTEEGALSPAGGLCKTLWERKNLVSQAHKDQEIFSKWKVLGKGNSRDVPLPAPGYFPCLSKPPFFTSSHSPLLSHAHPHQSKLYCSILPAPEMFPIHSSIISKLYKSYCLFHMLNYILSCSLKCCLDTIRKQRNQVYVQRLSCNISFEFSLTQVSDCTWQIPSKVLTELGDF